LKRLVQLAAALWVGRWLAQEVAMQIGKARPPSNG
jgi:hypothetical protein